MIMKGIMEDQELDKFTQKILAKFNLYRTKKQEITDDLYHEWKEMLGKLLVSYGAPEILKSADSCCMRLSHFPTPRDVFNYLPEKDAGISGWADRSLPDYRQAIFQYSGFCRDAYRKMDARTQGLLEEVILLSKQKNVNPRDALQGVFRYCLKPELLTDVSAFDRTQQPDIHSKQARDRPDTGFIAPERVSSDANQLS